MDEAKFLLAPPTNLEESFAGLEPNVGTLVPNSGLTTSWLNLDKTELDGFGFGKEVKPPDGLIEMVADCGSGDTGLVGLSSSFACTLSSTGKEGLPLLNASMSTFVGLYAEGNVSKGCLEKSLSFISSSSPQPSSSAFLGGNEGFGLIIDGLGFGVESSGAERFDAGLGAGLNLEPVDEDGVKLWIEYLAPDALETVFIMSSTSKSSLSLAVIST